MKSSFLSILILLSISGFGQQWSDFKFDEYLTVTIPSYYEIIDTLGQRVVKAPIDNAIVMIQRAPNEGAHAINVGDKAELKKSINGFIDGMMAGQKGKLIETKFFEKDSLLMARYSCSASMGEEAQLRHFQLIFVKENWYVIQFWEVESLSADLTDERERLFSSIQFQSGLSIQDQLSHTIEGSSSYKIGYLVGRLLGFAAIGLVIFLVVRAVRKK